MKPSDEDLANTMRQAVRDYNAAAKACAERGLTAYSQQQYKKPRGQEVGYYELPVPTIYKTTRTPL